jgi:hypothetical protein
MRPYTVRHSVRPASEPYSYVSLICRIFRAALPFAFVVDAGKDGSLGHPEIKGNLHIATLRSAKQRLGETTFQGARGFSWKDVKVGDHRFALKLGSATKLIILRETT